MLQCIILIELLLIVYFLFEALVEKYVIAMKNGNLPNYKELNKKEHATSLLLSCAVILIAVLPIALYSSKPILLLLYPTFLLSRRFFSHFLKIFRKRPFSVIEGDLFFDNLSRKIFGKNGSLKEILVILSIKFLYLFLFFKFLLT